MTTARIVVLGSINMDLTCRTDRLPRPGETLLGTAFATAPGGKGANQAIAAAKAGARTTFLGATGDDAFAVDLRRALTDAHVDDSLLRTVPGPSGIAAITVDQHGENTIVVVPGANSSMTELTEGELSTIAQADILLCQLEIPIVTVTAAFEHARAHGVMTVLNPSPVQSLPDALVAATDVLIVNESEESAVGDAARSIETVVTTLGASGARMHGPHSFATEAPVVDAIDTTGAGDAFAGAMSAAWHRGPQHAVAWACAAGAWAASRAGASSSSGTHAEIDALFAHLHDRHS